MLLPLIAILLPLYAACVLPAFAASPGRREAFTLLTGISLVAVMAAAVNLLFKGVAVSAALPPLGAGLQLAFKLEPLGAVFALVAAFLWVVTTIYSIGYMRANKEKHQTRFYVCFAIAIACAMGIAFAGNLFTLFVFYEGLTVSTFPLVTHKGTEEARRSGRTYLAMLLGTSIGLLLPAIFLVYTYTGTMDFQPGGVLAESGSPAIAALILLLFTYGVGKAALMPFHRWLPAAMVAPTPVSALLHAVAVVKAGVFTLTKVIVYIFGIDYLREISAANWWHGGWLPCIAGLTIILASVVALREDNFKRMLAYSTISQLSYVVLAAALLAPKAAMAAAIHIAAHAFGKITLFFAAGAVYTATHKTKISELNGIGRRMPITMTCFALGAFTLIGLPPTIGFLSKWYLLGSAIENAQYMAVAVIAFSTLLNAAYFLPILYAAWFKEEAAGTPARARSEAPVPIIIALMVSAGMTLALFFYPNILLGLAGRLP